MGQLPASFLSKGFNKGKRMARKLASHLTATERQHMRLTALRLELWRRVTAVLGLDDE